MKKKVFTGNYNNWWRHLRSGSGGEISVGAFFETTLSKVSPCQKEIYSENLNDISAYQLHYPGLYKKMYSHKKKHVILRWKSDIRMKQEIKKEKEEIKVLPRLLNVSSNKNHFIIVTWVHFFTFFTTNFLYHFFRFLLSIHV